MSPDNMASLALTARAVAAEWDVELGPAFRLARFSYVAPAGEDTVLKVTSPEDDESTEEADALALWDGHGAVRLLRRDARRRALLLERARPGGDLAAVPEPDATAIAVAVGRCLWRPAGEPLRWIGDHVPRWLADAEPVASLELLALARTLYDGLDVGRSTLVHGDFHHHNLLAAGSRYVAIDPKPMLGEPEFDVASFLWNPLPYRMRRDVTEHRLASFAATGLDQERMRAWAVIRGAYLGVDPHTAGVLRALV